MHHDRCSATGLIQRAGGRGHHGDSRRHCLERREPEPFVERGIRQCPSAVEQGRQRRIADEARRHDPIPNMALGDGETQGVAAPSLRTDQHKLQIRELVGDDTECSHETRQVLARLCRAHAEQIRTTKVHRSRDHRGIGCRKCRDA